MPVVIDGTWTALEDSWRERLEAAQRIHEQQHTEETRAEYMRLLKIFTNLVLRRELPPKMA